MDARRLTREEFGSVVKLAIECKHDLTSCSSLVQAGKMLSARSGLNVTDKCAKNVMQILGMKIQNRCPGNIRSRTSELAEMICDIVNNIEREFGITVLSRNKIACLEDIIRKRRTSQQ